MPISTARKSSVAQVTPLLSELREGNMVNNLEELTRSASDAAADIHRLQNEVQAGLMQKRTKLCKVEGVSQLRMTNVRRCLINFV